MKYLESNHKYWNRKYYSPNVENFIFRLKSTLLNRHIKKKRLTVLDYGCGEGSNIKYLINSYNYDGYGVDISEPSIKLCQKNIKKNRFKLIKSEVDENDKFFKTKFDLIISVQTLYYLNDEDMKKRIMSLNKMLKPGGYVFFTMMSTNHYLFKFCSNKKIDKNGLTLVDVGTDKNYRLRQKQPTYRHYINFSKNQNHIKKRFSIFKPINIGYYDMSLENIKKSRYHFTFFGKKK
jgi:cyclopropane fatty-acyl-phospholipid synthase-like methyltransferase